jgi:glucan phosphorylase
VNAEAEALARAASRGSLASKALGKRTFYETLDLDVDAAYAVACEAMASSAVTDDGRESMRAFLEKRPASTRRVADAAASRRMPGTVAYFCMEFGLHEDFPIYAGGLGILAGTT